MSRFSQRLIYIAFALFASVGAMTADAKEPEIPKIASLCFGRYMIDLPEGAQIQELGQQSEFMFGEIKSEHASAGLAEFTSKMDKREAELKAVKQKDGFTLTKSFSPTLDSRIFTLSRTYDLFPNEPPSTGLELYRLSGSQIFSMKETGFNKTFPQIVERVKTEVIPHIRERQLSEIPSEPGFCIKDGFIFDDGSKEQFEHARMQINFKQWPDLWVKVFSQTVPKAGDPSLLERLDSHPLPAIYASVAHQFKTLRRGKHEVRGFKGEEILELFPTDEGFMKHSFRWEALGEVKSIFKPRLVLEFESGWQPNGGHRRPSLSDEQAIKMFDGIVNSIRLRPTSAPPKSSAADLPKTPLGELAMTGRPCPQTGWWRCNEGSEVAGGKRQHFIAGEIMPHALLLGTPTLWQKLKGEQPSHESVTVWKLVDYDDVPVVPAPVVGAAESTPNTQAADEPAANLNKDSEPPNNG